MLWIPESRCIRISTVCVGVPKIPDVRELRFALVCYFTCVRELSEWICQADLRRSEIGYWQEIYFDLLRNNGTLTTLVAFHIQLHIVRIHSCITMHRVLLGRTAPVCEIPVPFYHCSCICNRSVPKIDAFCFAGGRLEIKISAGQWIHN